MRRLAVCFIVVCLLALSATATVAATVVVNVFDTDFSTNAPGQAIADAVIRVGDTIRWQFVGGFHTTTSVTGLSESWDSGLKTSGTYDHTFTNPGLFRYYCAVHGDELANGQTTGMAGTITVLPPPSRYDINGDGKPDMLLRNQSSGVLASWYLNGTSRTGTAYIQPSPGTDWNLVAVADFNANDKPDLVFQNQNTGAVVVYLMNGTTIASRQYITIGLPPEWKVVGAADMSGDQKPDLLLQNQNTGAITCWYMNGTAVTNRVYIYPTPAFGADRINPNWKVVANGDFDGDGDTDLIFYNEVTGGISCWLMNGVTLLNGVYVRVAGDTIWKLVGSADLNNDNHPDLIFQNLTTGGVSCWFMDGTKRLSSTYLFAALGANIRVVGLR